MDWEDVDAYWTVDKALSQSTRDTYRQRLKTLGLGPDWDPDEARAALAEKIHDGISDGAVNPYLYAIKALAQAHGETFDVDPRPQAPSEIRYLTEEEITQLRAETTGRLKRALIDFLLNVGCRSSVCVSIDRDHVDPHAKTVRIEHPAKGGRKRTLPLPGWMFSPKRPFGAYLWKRDRTWGSHDGSLWLDQYCTALSQRQLQRRMREISDETGVNVTVTLLRHTCARRLRERGAGLFYIQRWLGHQQISSTQVYAQVGDAELENVRDTVREKDPHQRDHDA